MLEPSSSDLLQHLVIPMLQEIQEQFGYIPCEAVDWLSTKLKISKQEIYGVATFYNHFRLNPPGKHEIKVCLGTACHVGGGEKLLDTISEKIGIDPGETTPDGKFCQKWVDMNEPLFHNKAAFPIIMMGFDETNRLKDLQRKLNHSLT